VKKAPGYCPQRGDFIWITLAPSQGHEQAGRRPALVLSPKSYNRKTGLCVICPATRQRKGYAFEVTYMSAGNQPSVILADHVRCVDWRVRRVQRIGRVPEEVIDDVVARLEALIIAPDA
jgi:mRNA interferase MazF